MGADQPDNADRCAELAAVSCSTPSKPRPLTSRSHPRRDSEPRFRRSAQRLADEVARQPALDELPELVALLSP